MEDNIVNMKVSNMCPSTPTCVEATVDNYLQILVNYMKKNKQEYANAANGLEALQLFQAEPLLFKVIFMGTC